MTNEELKQWDEMRARLQLAVDQAQSEEDKAAAVKALEQAEAAHQAKFQAYTQKCQQDYLQKFMGSR